jgi:hypothetical protein
MAFIRNKKVVFLDQKMMDNCMWIFSHEMAKDIHGERVFI